MKRRGELGERVARVLMGEEDEERRKARERVEKRRNYRAMEKLVEQMLKTSKARQG